MFMAVSRTIERASRMGTPEAMSVPSVRMVRATMLFSISEPMTGMYSLSLSRMYAPVRLSRIRLNVSQMATGISGMMYQYLTNQREVAISMSVIHGSFILKSAKIFSNFGMMKIMMNARISTATEMTTAG